MSAVILSKKELQISVLQARNICVFFGQSLILEIPKNKHQISNKLEAPITKFSNSSISLLTIGIWDLFVICHLGFGICGFAAPCSSVACFLARRAAQ